MAFGIDFKNVFSNNVKKEQAKGHKAQKPQSSIYAQMQNWSAAQEKVTQEFEIKFSALEAKTSDKTTPDEAKKLLKELDALQQEYTQAQEKAGSTFDFMEGDYNISDAKTFIPAYQKQTEKLAQGDIEAWDTNKDGKVDIDEYKAAQLQSNGEKITDTNAVKYTEEVYKAMDINGDDNLSTNEIQGFYAALDNADGSVDGKISADTLGADFTSDKFKRNISEFQAYLQ